jgi:hypothetical protein
MDQEHAHERLLRWLIAHGFEPVETPEPKAMWRILGRAADRARWLGAVRALVAAADDAGWRIDISEAYMQKDGALARAWRVVLDASDLEAIASDLPSYELEEVPLAGASPGRNATIGGRRGAAPVGEAVVGPAAARARALGT